MGVSLPVGVSLPAPGGRFSVRTHSPAWPGPGATSMLGIELESPDRVRGEGGSLFSAPPLPLQTTNSITKHQSGHNIENVTNV